MKSIDEMLIIPEINEEDRKRIYGIMDYVLAEGGSFANERSVKGMLSRLYSYSMEEDRDFLSNIYSSIKYESNF